MDLHDKLARERRARLAAERLLEQKSRELFDANRRLALRADALTEEVAQTRQAADELRGRTHEVMNELAEVSKDFTVARQRLWDSLETVKDGFSLFGPDDRLVIGNSAFFGLFEGLEAVSPGIRYDEIIRLAVAEGLFDIGDERPQDYVESLLSRWHLDPVPPRVVRLWTGEYLKLTDRRTPSGDMVCLAINITDMMRMWAAVEAIPDAFVLYDAEDRLVMCNDRYREFYAESAPAMVPGARFEDILRHGLAHGQYTDAVGREEEWLAERLAKHREAKAPVEQRLADGRWLRILEQRTPDGGIVGLRVDISEQKRQQEALEHARVAAEAANRAKSAFLANMSHELRTPMNGVVGMAELLCETEMSEDQRLYAHTIRESGEALLGLLNDVLDYSKIEADKLTLHPAPFDLERIIHEVATLLQAPARDKRLDMLIDYDIFLPTRFVGDGARVRQVLTNLVGNAVKFTEAGHVLVRVVGFEDAPGSYQVHLIVEDTGIGIAPELQEHIFGEFNQVDDQENRQFEGTGLGLAITQRLIGMMGGEIWLVSGKGTGACFGIRLTLPVCEGADELPAAPATCARRVLVVDDQEVNRTILERQLGQLGLEVVSHVCGELALQETGRFDLVLTDHRMPGMDGMSLARALRDRGYGGPILMLSSNPTRMRASDDPVACGVDLVLQKPLLRRALYEAVAQLAPPAAGKPVRLPIPPAPLAAPVAHGATPMRVLAAEDNRTNRLVLEKMLDGLALDIRFVKDGHEAVAAFAEARPDLILMDISMPGCDGKEATRRIRALEAGSDAAPVPVVALTAHALIGDVDAILEAGLNGCLTKPLRKSEIVETLEAYRPEGCLPIRGQAAG
ncbi:response regulator [Rhodovulum sp. MB263]|uniref:response regulator n=1 Tax=unclassified Rhodovulum TaxID=2631432 RepID=UPI0009B79329|nr:response regulator [Rhodovulum sp. MB263]ARC90257.1 hybrid sensor histidine kinase/response regulator [Rhodovulum sp. MB263]